MSNKQIFQVYHGPGNVRYGPTGVDLSDFIVSERGIERPAERSVPSIKGWLMRGLRVDPQTSDITINVIVSRATEGFYWELMPVQNSRVWRWYLENALQRGWPLALVPFVHPKDPGVQTNMDDGEGPSAEVNETSVEEVNAREDGGVVAPVGIQPGGVADEGETVGAIVDEMEREDSDNERVEEVDSSDDETDINPAEWASEDFSRLIVSEEDSVRWEYKENEVIQGAIYSRAEDMKEAVKHFAVSLHREFWVAKSNRSQYEVRCVKEKDGCPWRVHAYKGKWKDYWTVSVVTKHTCFLPSVQKYHMNITCAFVASEMYAHVIDNLTYEPRSIIRHIEETYKYTISYAKAWRAKQKIIEMRFGTYEASYDNLPRLLGVIEERNPGSSYEVKKFPSIEHPGKSVLQRAFLALHACKMAFVNCRPVLCIDGTFLTGKYRGQILTAIGVDGNNQIRTTACAYIEWVDTENPVLDLTTCLQEGRWYFASESTEQYLQRKAAYERQCREQQSDWRVLTTALPPWEARPRYRCGDRCQVLRSINPTTLGRRFFVCPNILDDDFMEPPRRCQYREWIDTRRVLTPPSRVVQLELPEQYRVTKARFERGEGSSRRG
uniref:Transposase MuDR plant domain-containing protein n=1 Tax=Oryza sativa subsp. japonica TaxID=39947 RepID=Q75J80_ORYSJ|nr:hypothetical protein [Oryza sativa Japonica Group]